ncbi:hypothetical protein B0H63DRAFT_525384 [Podospora didyma]|uniref:Autophagy-related protein 2 n=1 Tax=Podospora didyma TaxID=330526 RepID=A0AAE0NC86_9PEZI|nr:hypothetical protein B0H63DRAFT_525384 [Podospora didyma]
MASLFQAFRNSLMPKQLLRFALSRLELLDEQTLDIENLDFALGRNTVLEFRDVGLILQLIRFNLFPQKLERLLKLPPTFSIQRAKVLVLRVTIPVDFYASPITAEIDGVDVRLKVTSKDQQARKRRKDKGAGDVVPSAVDLAQSFLDTQPTTEKKELEEALAAETQDLAASAISEAESDDGSTFGTGQTLSLPTFLADFLQGIVDRMQIRVQGVTFQVDMEVPVDPSTPTPELVTFQLALETINVEGVTTPTRSEDGTPNIVHKGGKRHILLDNIRAFLISEANVFSALVPSPSIPSSVASRSPAVTPAPSFSPPSAGLEMSVGSNAMTNSSELAQSQYPLQDNVDSFDIPYDLDGNDVEDETGEPASSLSTPRASVYQDFSPPPPPMEYHAQSAIIKPEPAPWAEFEREVQSEPYLRRPASLSALRIPSPGVSVHSEVASTGSGSSEAEDLTQSHLYSHEEAESMYMSAFSQAQSVKLRSAMPGAWDEGDDGTWNDDSPPQQAASFYSTNNADPTPPHQESLDIPAQESIVLAGSPNLEPVTERPRTPIDNTVPVSYEAQASPEEQSPVREPEPQQDDVPTPRGPTRLVKEIVSLSSISIYVPSTPKHIQIPSPDLGKSVSPHLPGAFSVYSAGPTSPGLAPIPINPIVQPHDGSIEIILRPVEIRFDASIGFLLAMIVSRLLEATQIQPNDDADSGTANSSSKTPDIKLAIEELSIHFLEKLAGVADTPQRIFEKHAAGFDSDVLLKATLTDLDASVSHSGPQTEASISIEKFKFGYANDDIISFDRQVQLYESVANTFPSAGQDISVKIKTSSDNSRIEVNTLPLHIKLDLQKLDETFSWFGGLSSFLNMGSSITSNASRGVKSPAKSPQKPRGVRFEAPINPNDHTAAKENKIGLRINGLQLDVNGKECSVVLNTSALKLVSREEGLGIHLSKVRLAGPYLRNSRAEVPVEVLIADTRLEYLMVPRGKDLDKLLELITPSKVKFDENGDEIMVDTLLRQRKKGPVLCLTVNRVRVEAGRLQQLACLPSLMEDLAKLGTVAKYLPEDDRPGLLTLGHIKNVDCVIEIGGRFGAIGASLKGLELAHITVPSLVAVAVSGISVHRNQIEELVATSTTHAPGSSQRPPVLMMRMIDDIEPVIKVKLMGLSVEYRVPTIMDVLGLAADATPQDFESSLAASVANLGDHAHAAIKGASLAAEQSKGAKPIKVDLTLNDCIIGLNPLGLASKLALVLTDTHVVVIPGKRNSVNANANLKKASILLIDDISLLESSEGPFKTIRYSPVTPSFQVTELCRQGYVSICEISAAKATVKVVRDADGEAHAEVEVRDNLVVLETCADSTQTLIALANALKPPTPPSKEIKYRTSVVPVEDLLASISGDMFGKAEGSYDFDDDFGMVRDPGSDNGGDDDYFGDESDSPLRMDSQYYDEEAIHHEELFDATAPSLMVGGTMVEDTNDGVLLSTARLDHESSSDDLVIEDNYFEPLSVVRGTAHRWNSKRNTYDQSNDVRVQHSPLKVAVRDVHVIWHLFDGYDWSRTREVITKAVQDVEAKAQKVRDRKHRPEDSMEDETEINDYLFNSIYIGIKIDPKRDHEMDLTQAINDQLHDNATETESIAATTVTNATVRAGGQHQSKTKRLKLNRSKRHKITFELKGVNIDFVTFPADSNETLNSIDVRINDLDVFDHVPTSTWKKFAMYDFDHGERELGASMVHLEFLTTKPVPSMPASEIVLKVTVLPLRLHVDQDALDFITRFFEFKDDSMPIHASPSDVPFIQRAEINDIPIKLDFKPKHLDYASLRSGHTKELMHIVTLEDARLVLRHVILYGVSGFDRLGNQLNDIWTDNVKSTQLQGILSGVASVRSFANAASGFRELVEIPIREYRKDGRIVRSIGKGAAAFAKTTGTEVVKLGAKLAIGTQYALQGAEGLLVSNPRREGKLVAADESGDEEFPEERKQISLYADQPLGIVQGMRGAYASLARDLSMAKDAIIAVPAEVMESRNAQGAAAAMLRRAPTIIFRPAIGATKAIGQTLLGATNSLDPENRRRMDAKYKKH